MGRLIYSGIMSLDGYTTDRDGEFDWSAPDEEVHAFINDLERPIGTYLYGRRMYETVAVWETDPSLAEGPPVMRDFAQIWQAAEKIVYSGTLLEPLTKRTRIERTFEPDTVRELKERTGHDIEIGGPELAAHAVRAGLVDEYHLFLNPVVVGGGKPYLPSGMHRELELLDQHRFANGVVFLRYRQT
ncbi:dihydrofolate reductase family protein [Amycolatopsis sp. K13G38]|uniref:Dihydrofolate reductase family protein n=1 Tax=Amycolatopsis acididurans TaxID=2724524 RepID=A0ABX1JAE2_9PSEU|nr:dihydrofolate reductase family protein [Amycolatopsis acididurans]NKQ55869.1 dihydrofolate reductase family protein [Amycolatopsis acididurans]